MNGIYYAVFVAAILFIIRWYVQNERLGPDSDGRAGLLAMTAPPQPKNGLEIAGSNGARVRAEPPSREQPRQE